ncbi:para [Symbiodinium necroappetens]|uniref:Para protein n=1 Tax=Symbiodinium necroappetens TaxID=1628268 RepID=A0A812IT84_9DINO|nr:para [Symbiodinium necroappetens]
MEGNIRPMNPDTFSSSCLKPFLAQVAHVVEEHERLVAENLRLKANSGVSEAVPAVPGLFLDAENDEILEERLQIQKDSSNARVKSKDPPRFENGSFSVVPELSGILEVSVEDTQTEAVEASKKGMAQAVFKDSMDMKQAVREQLMKDGKGYDVKNFYHQTGIAQHIARSPRFENITMAIIGIYAIWMAIDTDLNDDVITEADPVFFVVEQVFCTYFLAELVVRFLAFEEKRNCMKDAWFVFDLALVLMMILENWVLSLVLLATGAGDTDGILANANILRLARLMRLTRLLRMARLLRMVPELLILVKAIAAAMRSVGFTLILLFIVLYVFGIGFTQLLKGSELLEDRFKGVALSMQMLFLHCTLLDSISELVEIFMEDQQWVALALLYSFLILSAITIANMLIGVICEVITAVAAAEKEAIQITFVKDTLLRVMGRSDANTDGRLQKSEFFKIARDKQAVKALKELGVDMITLIDFADIIFENASQAEADDADSEELSFSEFMEVILQFRGSNTATVKDMVDFRKWFTVQYRQMLREDIEEILAGKGSQPLGRRHLQPVGLRQTIFSGTAHRWTPPIQDGDHVSVNI